MSVHNKGSDEGSWFVPDSSDDEAGGPFFDDEVETNSDSGDDVSAGLPHCISSMLFDDSMPYKRLLELRGEANLTLPSIVVCGVQSHGKSSTLERIAQLEVFPRDSSICARMAVRLLLRNSGKKAEKRTIKVRIFDTVDNKGMRPSWTDIPEGMPVHEATRAIMRDFVDTKHKGVKNAIDSRHELQVMLQAPDVPTIDLVGLPGIDSLAEDAASMLLAKRFLAKEDTLVVAVACASDRQLRASAIWRLLSETKNPTVVALTHMDLSRHSKADMIDILNKEAKFVTDCSTVQSVIPVVNRDTLSACEKVTLQGAMASEEALLTPKLEQIGVLFNPSQHGIRAVVGALGNMLHEYMANTWGRAELYKLIFELVPIAKEIGVADAECRRELECKVELVGEAANTLLGLMPTCPGIKQIVADIEKVVRASKSGNVDNDSVRACSQWTEADLFCASAKGNKALVKALLDSDADVHARDTLGETPLHVACQNGHEGVAKLLLDNGADVHAKGSSGNTPLHNASLKGHDVVTKLLLDNGADVHVRMDEGWLALHIACLCGHEVVAKLLLENVANVHAKKDDGQLALHIACQNGYEGVAKLLLDSAADVHAKTNSGKTALHDACENGHEGVAKLLLDNGADLHAKNDDGWLALHSACLKGHEGVAKLLLDNGAGVSAKDKLGLTALDLARTCGHESVAKLLLDNSTDVHARDNNGWLALHDACYTGHEGVAKLLLGNGADVHAKSNIGSTPLHDACKKDHKGVAKLLVDNGADVHAKDNCGDTPLHDACSNGHEGVARLLLGNGADVHANSNNSDTPLHKACGNGHEGVAKLLLDYSADVHAENDCGSTPLHDACENRHEGVAKLLLGYGADVHAKDKYGYAPLHDACWNGHEGVAKLLLDNGASVHAKANNGSTALDVACQKGHEGIAALLRNHREWL